MKSSRHRLLVAFALAGAGHAALFAAAFALRAGRDTEPEAEVACVIETESGGGAPAGPASAADAPPGTAQIHTPRPMPAPPVTPPAPTSTPPAPPRPAIPDPPPAKPTEPGHTAATPQPTAPPPTTGQPPAKSVPAGAVTGTGSGAGSGAYPGAGDGPGTAPAGTGIVAARYRRRVSPDYPARARRLGLEGDVVLQIHLSATGEPRAVEIRKSSGSRLLDDAARDAALDSEYEPARRDGRAVSSVAETTVAFRLRD